MCFITGIFGRPSQEGTRSHASIHRPNSYRVSVVTSGIARGAKEATVFLEGRRFGFQIDYKRS